MQSESRRWCESQIEADASELAADAKAKADADANQNRCWRKS
jgi:hypothetical protein